MDLKTRYSEKLIVNLGEVSLKDVALVGDKNASLGELIHLNDEYEIKMPDGFAITSIAYWDFFYFNKLKEPLEQLLKKLDKGNLKNIETISDTAGQLIITSKLPDEITRLIKMKYDDMQEKFGKNCDIAVRSSATSEDFPDAGLVIQHDSYLNVRGINDILHAVLHCYASLFTQHAIKFHEDKDVDHLKTAVSVCIQKMVRSDLGCSGGCFVVEPMSGFENIIRIAGSWGLGENILQGIVEPDEYIVFKKSDGKLATIKKKLGSKEKMRVYLKTGDHLAGHTTVNIETPEKKRKQFVLNNVEINNLARAVINIEKHYGRPMDIEWAKDGLTKEVFIVGVTTATPQTHNINRI